VFSFSRDRSRSGIKPCNHKNQIWDKSRNRLLGYLQSREREFASFINLYLSLWRVPWTVRVPSPHSGLGGAPQESNNQKGSPKNQTIKIPRIPLSHPTRFRNQNNQNPGKIPGKRKHCTTVAYGPYAARRNEARAMAHTSAPMRRTNHCLLLGCRVYHYST